jgi:hypothetical protein
LKLITCSLFESFLIEKMENVEDYMMMMLVLRMIVF